MGVSIYDFPSPVTHAHLRRPPLYARAADPAIVLSLHPRQQARRRGRQAQVPRQHGPAARLRLPGLPYPWLALAAAVLPRRGLRTFVPDLGGYEETLLPGATWTFIWSLLHHWFLPFLTVFLVSFGGWAIGMRNLVIYELETDYATVPRVAGRAPSAWSASTPTTTPSLPQLSGLALALGVVIGGNIVTEIVFHYPGLGPDLRGHRAMRTTSCCRASSCSSSSGCCSRTSSSTSSM